jgi:hypothetical protein
VNFDFLVENQTDKSLRLEAICLLVLDANNKLVTRRFLDHNALSPSIHTLPQRQLPPKGSISIFNPFHTFPTGWPVAKLDYELVWASETGEVQFRSQVGVRPMAYQTRTNLELPLEGRLLVHDGHDFYSHHRRIDLTHPIAKQLKMKFNPMLYAYDFCVTGPDGQLYKNKGQNLEEWLGFGAPVYAPADGQVVDVVANIPDNTLKDGRIHFGRELLLDNPKSLAGNFVVMDHGNGEFSAISHLKHGSLKVKKGETVRKGQLIAELGFSGDTGGHVHIHYQLQNGPDVFAAESIPDTGHPG